MAVANPPQNGAQTVSVPPGGGGIFDVFAHVDLGQVGLLKVGDVHGTMSH
jgi:hypothetical protein